jgi:hypothetical protein
MALEVQLPHTWQRRGVAVARQGNGCNVVGDPCVVWDGDEGLWRMFLVWDPAGHGQALCPDPVADPTNWTFAGPLRFTNPEALIGAQTHKPFVVLDPERPGRAAHPGGRYALLLVSGARPKVVQRAWAERLAGPWTVEPGPLIPTGSEEAFDGRHTDAVSGYYFPARETFLYFYMGYPLRPQPHRPSPYGSAVGVAVQGLGERGVRKQGIALAPHPRVGHWGGGWVGGLQLLPGRRHRWLGVVNASPTPPDPDDTSIAREEPPPSLGGLAFSDEEWPVGGWQWAEEPFERLAEVPPAAAAAGERENFWRHYALPLHDGSVALFYNAGPYGREEIFVKVGR